eukprot:TRINITY_DN7465_c0_g1_i1.p1 TRINITY_DN7465_c0_g1~~TRINITY_DN7465_c0_g1_i1.p1  ORF type:complete len:174 (+),score=15.27 TRINITY_DN7465_c0_g1_i1:72-524(+)
MMNIDTLLNISNDLLDELDDEGYTSFYLESAEVDLDFIQYALVNKYPAPILPNRNGSLVNQTSVNFDIVFMGDFTPSTLELYYDPSISFLLKGHKVSEDSDGETESDDQTTTIILATIFCSLFGIVVLVALVGTIIFILYKKKMLRFDAF